MLCSRSTLSASSRVHCSSNLSSGSLTINGIMISTTGLPPARRRVTAACINARTCIRYRPGLTMPSRHPRVPSISFRSDLWRLAPAFGQIGVRSNFQRPQPVGPTQDDAERPAGLGRDDRHLADDDLTGCSVDRDDVTLAGDRAADGKGPGRKVDL